MYHNKCECTLVLFVTVLINSRRQEAKATFHQALCYSVTHEYTFDLSSFG